MAIEDQLLMKARRLPGLIALAILTVQGTAFAHGGGLNADGCHHNRKTGDYHCHRTPAAEAPRTTLNSRATDARVTSLSTSADSPSLSDRPFANCTDARAAGAAPVYAGDPGYGAHLDRDRDGVGCE